MVFCQEGSLLHGAALCIMGHHTPDLCPPGATRGQNIQWGREPRPQAALPPYSPRPQLRYTGVPPARAGMDMTTSAGSLVGSRAGSLQAGAGVWAAGLRVHMRLAGSSSGFSHTIFQSGCSSAHASTHIRNSGSPASLEAWVPLPSR